MMEIAAMKERSGSCQGAKALGTDSWGSSSLVRPSITAGWGGAGEVPVLAQLLTLHSTLPDGVQSLWFSNLKLRVLAGSLQRPSMEAAELRASTDLPGSIV